MMKKITVIFIFLILGQYGFAEVSISLGVKPFYEIRHISAISDVSFETCELSLYFFNIFGISLKGSSDKTLYIYRDTPNTTVTISAYFDFYWNFWNYPINESIHLSQILMISLGSELFDRDYGPGYNEEYSGRDPNLSVRIKYFFYFSIFGLFIEPEYNTSCSDLNVITGVSIRI